MSRGRLQFGSAHPACEVQPVSMCSPTACVCLCPVHGRTVCGACVHTAAKCGVRRSQAKKKSTLPSHACTHDRYREVQGFRQCDGAAAAASTTTARVLLSLCCFACCDATASSLQKRFE
ncbi:hypothetical protein VPH35_114062 [Triticum aestivum]